jgi:hypothetical protein
MRKLSGVSMAAILSAAACAETAPAADSHLDCAALISAANHLSVEGRLKTEAAFDREALGASMTHLNAYAIPADIREPNAFKQANARRDELKNSETPVRIYDRAKACVTQTPERRPG